MSRYLRVENNHIFIQINSDDLNKILSDELLVHGSGQHIHIFELYPSAVINGIESLCSSITKNKVIIHIPKYMRDYDIFIKNKLKEIKGNWKIQIESKPVLFKSKKDAISRSIYVSFEEENNLCILKVWKVASSFMIIKNRYDENALRMKYPELYKDRIIKSFKKKTAKGILSSFKDDEDIWNFIMEESKRNEDA